MINVFVVVSDDGKEYIVNPNSDYNFGFTWNEEAEYEYMRKVELMVDEE